MRQRVQFRTSFCCFKKDLYKIKASGQHLSFNIYRQNSTWTYNKKTGDLKGILNFDFFKKEYETKFLTAPHFVNDASRKIFLMLYSITWPNFIVWLHLLLEILGNMCIEIICCTICDVINFEINHRYLIKPFFYITKITKNSGQKCKYLKNEKSFEAFSIIFKGLSLK